MQAPQNLKVFPELKISEFPRWPEPPLAAMVPAISVHRHPKWERSWLNLPSRLTVAGISNFRFAKLTFVEPS
jgi:hypothetical protein